MRNQNAFAMILVLAIAGATACGNDTAGVDPLDLSGGWALVVDVICPGTMSIDHEGAMFEVTGTVGGGSCPFAGSGEGSGMVTGSTISFGIGFGTASGPSGMGLGSVEFDGAIAAGGNRITGTYSSEHGRNGQWEATRQ